MKKISSFIASSIILVLVAASTSMSLSVAHAEQIDVSYLQTCLKDEGSSLDVLVLMDSSASLRDARADDGYARSIKDGSDPERKRGKILKSSLKILRSLADESKRTLNISLRNFGNNSNPKELANLMQHWIPWTDKTSDTDLNHFVEQALYDDSTETEWTNGLISAKNQFKERIGQARLSGTKSCSIMFWITDGAPTDKTDPICTPDSNASINWFRENNILILGGLLQPKAGKEKQNASKFKPIIEGENCGDIQEGWTRGVVIEANDIDSLSWDFVGLIASIKNLVNLDGSNSSFYVDPSTSHLEIFIRGGNQQNWQINQPDGTPYCSSSNLNPIRCQVITDTEIGITTITVVPENPAKAAGTWSLTPRIEDGNFKVYGGLNTTSPGSEKTQPKLIISTGNTEIEEGGDANFQAKLVNADGTDFSLEGYKEIRICAKIESVQAASCKSGSTSASLTVKPAKTDKSVGFEAILISSHSDDREYRIAASAQIDVFLNGKFPNLVCSKNPSCLLDNLANKNDHATNTLEVTPPKSGSMDGRVFLVGYTVLSDKVQDRNFTFQIQKENEDEIEWNSQNTYFAPGDKLILTVSTDAAGDSEIQGVIKYRVLAGGEEIVRQLDFKFSVEHNANHWLQFGLLLLAYLITVGIPYLFLLWLARRAAVLNVPDGDFSFLVLPIEISKDGKLVELGALPAGSTFAPDYKKLEKRSLDSNTRSVTIDKALIESIPPKWNPFTLPKTRVSIPDSHLFTTYGEHAISYESAPFSSTLIKEIIVYFPAEGNFTALKMATVEMTVDESGLDFLESQYENTLSNTITSPTTPVIGNAIFIVSPYENREKSLVEVVSKLNLATENMNFIDWVAEVREIALKEALEHEATKKMAEEKEHAKQKGKNNNKLENVVGNKEQGEWSTGTSDPDEWGGNSNSRTTTEDLPGSSKKADTWE